MKRLSPTPSFFFVATLAVATLGLVGGCSVPQSESCVTYIECVAHVDGVFDLPSTNTEAYFPEGSCWKSAESSEKCTEFCEEANDSLKESLDLAQADRGPCI